ncbi:8-oxo-dGTP pyrophosphatase MutT (NUDIX family) [Nocardioides ginsengisegetis]|uniref:8-oxo-dGTP pyrophosphatase MutT (NUDIX family) n=1 Tax=Nocardioides ginsengisegetis TaxID=661491 RepID=A0A7W3J1F1_9ACTN|nr:NUDIX domain-containing protein [Nocardioides ginsengisegetis]MBA8804369.1 8-oxo-dGTP pyrophosphatase MutT (NUDIX family) [Nocardioides ginsengisegetis]
MPIPPFIAELRALVGTRELWLPAVTAVVRRRGTAGEELLLARRADNGEWAPVTGIVDPGEQPAVAAAREALEETGVVVTVDRLASVGVSPQVTHGNGDLGVYLDLTFACTWVGGEARVADDESTEVGWFPVDDLPDMAPFLLERIEAALADEVAARFVG